MGLFSYFYPCNKHKELREKQVQDYLLMTKSRHHSIYTRRLELFEKSTVSLYGIIE